MVALPDGSLIYRGGEQTRVIFCGGYVLSVFRLGCHVVHFWSGICIRWPNLVFALMFTVAYIFVLTFTIYKPVQTDGISQNFLSHMTSI